MSDEIKRLPPWLVRKVPKGGAVHDMKAGLRSRGLHTVCESARCPNIGECFSRPTATFMIMGDVCTRSCRFCAVDGGKPAPLDPNEPAMVAEHASELELKHVVITSVTRDDLPDGGADHFVKCTRAVKAKLPGATVEVLTPDFLGEETAIEIIAEADMDVFNHNLETVPQLYGKVRPGADYKRSLILLGKMKGLRPDVITKSGLMIGLGETIEQVLTVFDDLVKHKVDAITIGQYLRPSLKHLPVAEYIRPEVFDQLADEAKSAGIKHAFCGPLVRSSYNAQALFEDKS